MQWNKNTNLACYLSRIRPVTRRPINWSHAILHQLFKDLIDEKLDIGASWYLKQTQFTLNLIFITNRLMLHRILCYKLVPCNCIVLSGRDWDLILGGSHLDLESAIKSGQMPCDDKCAKFWLQENTANITHLNLAAMMTNFLWIKTGRLCWSISVLVNKQYFLLLLNVKICIRWNMWRFNPNYKLPVLCSRLQFIKIIKTSHVFGRVSYTAASVCLIVMDSSAWMAKETDKWQFATGERKLDVAAQNVVDKIGNTSVSVHNNFSPTFYYHVEFIFWTCWLGNRCKHDHSQRNQKQNIDYSPLGFHLIDILIFTWF